MTKIYVYWKGTADKSDRSILETSDTITVSTHKEIEQLKQDAAEAANRKVTSQTKLFLVY